MGLKKNLAKSLRRNLNKILVLSILSIMIVSFYILVDFGQMPSSVGMALSGVAIGGMFVSFVNIKPFEELHTPKKFYEESKRVIKESKKEEVRITSTTPGVILASEYNPIAFPFPTLRKPRKSGYRKEYFESLLEASRDNSVRVRYFFDKKNAAIVLKQYREQNCERYIEEGRKILGRFLKETNSNFKIRCGEITSTFRKVTIIGDEYIVKSERDEDTQKIRHGTLEKNKDEADRLRIEFDQQLWVNGEEVKGVSFIDRLIKE